MEGRLVVVFLFYRRTGRRHDFDNLLKQVLDIGNGICWLDDSQIDDAVQRRRIDRERPRTVIAAARALGGEEPD
jgi:Holliday junction resolvase RusA-like endonuclease